MNDNEFTPKDQPQSLGDRFRNLIEPALDDERRQATQLAILDDIFKALATRLEPVIERSLGNIFNQAAMVEQRKPDDKNVFIIKQLTEVGPQGEAKVPGVIRMGLPIATGFVEFAAHDIKELPGYIALHEKARELNVSLKLMNITADETKAPSGYPQPAMLIVDLTKSYEAGAIENAQLYPNLPPRAEAPAQKQKFNRGGKGGFNF